MIVDYTNNESVESTKNYLGSFMADNSTLDNISNTITEAYTENFSFIEQEFRMYNHSQINTAMVNKSYIYRTGSNEIDFVA